MITTTMTEKEMVDEINHDFQNVLGYLNYLELKFRRTIIKNKNFPFVLNHKYKSPRKNMWFIIKKVVSKKRSLMFYVVIYDTQIGHHAVLRTIINNNIRYNIFPPHFFSRYRLRTNSSSNGVDLILDFFIKNNEFECNMIDSIYCKTNEGIAIGQFTSGMNIFFKTFITNEMLNQKQIKMLIDEEINN